MSDDKTKTAIGATPLNVKVGATALVAGLAAWIWLGDWRWAVMGLLGLLLAAAVLAPRKETQRGDES